MRNVSQGARYEMARLRRRRFEANDDDGDGSNDDNDIDDDTQNMTEFSRNSLENCSFAPT